MIWRHLVRKVYTIFKRVKKKQTTKATSMLIRTRLSSLLRPLFTGLKISVSLWVRNRPALVWKVSYLTTFPKLTSFE